ncbi:MAG: FAD-dependent monooxygenase, partial [Mariprofundaceae bacterium]
MRFEQVDVVVVGGGMVGLVLACALKDTGLQTVVVGRAEAEVFESLGRDCRVSAIVRGNALALRGIGVWPHLRDAQPIRAMRVWDEHHPGGIRFDATELGEDPEGGAADALGWLVENVGLIDAARQTLLDAEHVELRCPAQCRTVRWLRESVEIELEEGGGLRAALVVGADGAASWLRGQAGIGVWSRDYRQKGIVATVRPERDHRGVAFQRFLPTGPLAMLPMTGGLCSIVWSAENDEADRLMAMDDTAFLNALNRAFGPMLGRIVETGARAAFPLRAQLARHWVRPRLALVGDAAHTIHPLAGLGVNLGIRDAMVLAQELADARRFGEDIGAMD